MHDAQRVNFQKQSNKQTNKQSINQSNNQTINQMSSDHQVIKDIGMGKVEGRPSIRLSTDRRLT